MRSITTKLILAFLLVSLISIGTMVVLTRLSTRREFDKFVSNQYQAELVENLGNYYRENNSWDGVELAHMGYMPNQMGYAGQPSNFCVTNLDGIVVRGSFSHEPGDVVSAETLEN